MHAVENRPKTILWEMEIQFYNQRALKLCKVKVDHVEGLQHVLQVIQNSW